MNKQRPCILRNVITQTVKLNQMNVKSMWLSLSLNQSVANFFVVIEWRSKCLMNRSSVVLRLTRRHIIKPLELVVEVWELSRCQCVTRLCYFMLQCVLPLNSLFSSKTKSTGAQIKWLSQGSCSVVQPVSSNTHLAALLTANFSSVVSHLLWGTI